ncbi:MAG TPA: hypothetical protein VHZ51_27130 [Ktedonobacteraceae bacterium]|nr:hypothetical protein [Ktedonobacteraceae bacterium]
MTTQTRTTFAVPCEPQHFETPPNPRNSLCGNQKPSSGTQRSAYQVTPRAVPAGITHPMCKLPLLTDEQVGSGQSKRTAE